MHCLCVAFGGDECIVCMLQGLGDECIVCVLQGLVAMSADLEEVVMSVFFVCCRVWW